MTYRIDLDDQSVVTFEAIRNRSAGSSPPMTGDQPSEADSCWTVPAQSRIAIERLTSPHDVAYRFAEHNEEIGCGRLIWTVVTPRAIDGTTGAFDARLSFQSERWVQTGTDHVQSRFRQSVAVAASGEQSPEQAEVREPWAYFEDDVSVEKLQEVRVPAFSAAPGNAYDVVWDFMDLSASLDRTSGFARPMQSAVATVANASIIFDAGTIPVDFHVDARGRSPDGDLLGYATATLSVPYGPSQSPEVRFEVPNTYGVHEVQRRGPDGRYYAIDNADFGTREDDGRLELILGAPAFGTTTQPATATYRIIFSAPNTKALEPAQAVVVMPLLFLPVVALIIAQRAVSRYARRVKREQKVNRRILQAIVFAGWGLYAGAILAVLVSGSALLLVSWPLGWRAWTLFSILIVSIGAAIAAAILARQWEISWAQHELTERERIQKELERSNQELEQFAYVASHDLKEPLRMVAGYTQLLERRYQDQLDDNGKQFIHYAADGAERMQAMVDDLLRYSRVRSDRSRVEPVDLDHVMFVVRSNLQESLRERKVDLRCDALPTIMGDPTQMAQLFQNLIHNAIKFNVKKRPIVWVAAERKGAFWNISVRDNGIGILARDQERIFQIFQRLHSREDYPGSGIGLALCKKIVEQNGGEISVASEKGRGTTFTCRLPAAPSPPKVLPAPAPAGAASV